MSKRRVGRRKRAPPRYEFIREETRKPALFPPASKLPCGCHCKGGCGDPYAACMWPCGEHIPF